MDFIVEPVRAAPGTSSPVVARVAVPALWHNRASRLGLRILQWNTVVFILLLSHDLFGGARSPLVGVVAYLVTPSVSVLACALVVAGMLWTGLVTRRTADLPIVWFDAASPTDRRRFFSLAAVGLASVGVISGGSYRSYQFTESAVFCGKACHAVMEPQFVTHQHSAHANVACAECHVGEGPEWFLRSKISGLRQVWALATDQVQRPIKTPLEKLRPARETCEHCHWPKQEVGAVERTFSHYLADARNTPFAVRLQMNVGNRAPHRGPLGGVHWHVTAGYKTEFIATDSDRQVIPWVRVTAPNGKVTEFRTRDFKGDPARHVVRRMDCMDCHNRPAHKFKSPGDAVDRALAARRLDARIPHLKAEAVEVLERSHESVEKAVAAIAEDLGRKHPDDPRMRPAIAEIQAIYRQNYFPAMKAGWTDYPENIGHKEFPGCMRCHDGEHVAVAPAAPRPRTISNDCRACHRIAGQGKDANRPGSGGRFKHPGGDYGGQQCYECHNDRFATAMARSQKEPVPASPGSATR